MDTVDEDCFPGEFHGTKTAVAGFIAVMLLAVAAVSVIAAVMLSLPLDLPPAILAR